MHISSSHLHAPMRAPIHAAVHNSPHPPLLAWQAEAYVMDRQFARAIRVYLSLAEHRAASGESEDRGGPPREPPPVRRSDRTEAAQGLREGGVGGRGAGGGAVVGRVDSLGGDGVGAGGRSDDSPYAHVFRMIEQHSLFDTVQVSRGRTKKRCRQGRRGGFPREGLDCDVVMRRLCRGCASKDFGQGGGGGEIHETLAAGDWKSWNRSPVVLRINSRIPDGRGVGRVRFLIARRGTRSLLTGTHVLSKSCMGR